MQFSSYTADRWFPTRQTLAARQRSRRRAESVRPVPVPPSRGGRRPPSAPTQSEPAGHPPAGTLRGAASTQDDHETEQKESEPPRNDPYRNHTTAATRSFTTTHTLPTGWTPPHGAAARPALRRPDRGCFRAAPALLPDRHRAAQPRAARTPQQPGRADTVRTEVLHGELTGAELVPLGTAHNGGLQGPAPVHRRRPRHRRGCSAPARARRTGHAPPPPTGPRSAACERADEVQ